MRFSQLKLFTGTAGAPARNERAARTIFDLDLLKPKPGSGLRFVRFSRNQPDAQPTSENRTNRKPDPNPKLFRELPGGERERLKN